MQTIKVSGQIGQWEGVQAFDSGEGQVILVLEADRSKARPSASGKMALTASTGGFGTLPNGLRVNLSAGFRL